ncbi:hypothetical protein ACGFNU_49825 [Spirillospora sp. NPDC048911]|uniref:hypothetical protein n=1 Tax=Spirillospora sp. NPDC048911 TaxID=3364527 RepID=UPI003716B6E2
MIAFAPPEEPYKNAYGNAVREHSMRSSDVWFWPGAADHEVGVIISGEDLIGRCRSWDGGQADPGISERLPLQWAVNDFG